MKHFYCNELCILSRSKETICETSLAILNLTTNLVLLGKFFQKTQFHSL